jgi:cyclophilin family peptidyl-prolyl cis-trans isomerase
MLTTDSQQMLATKLSRRSVVVVAAVALVAAACGTADGGAPTAPSDTSTSTTVAPVETVAGQVPTGYDEFRTQQVACGDDPAQAAVPMQFDAPADARVADTVTVTIETSCGPITAELDPSLAPESVNSFVFLAEQGYFDGTVSHRVLPGFMMQAGDPTATGFGGPGYTLPDEFPPADYLYERGTIAMANAGSGTTGSQFFIMFDTVDRLPPQYSVIGSVVGGLDTLDAIARVPLGRAPSSGDPSPSTPLQTVYLKSVSVNR